MKWLLTLLKSKSTLFMLFISVGACMLAVTYDVTLHHNMMLFSLIVSFPLIFSLQSAFKRREKALEYLGLLKSGLTSTYMSFELDKKLPAEGLVQLRAMLTELSTKLNRYLENGEGDPRMIYDQFDKVSSFMNAHKGELSAKTRVRVVRYMKDVYDSVAYLCGIKTHRTVTGLRYMAYGFVMLFPLIQAPVLVGSIGKSMPVIGLYSIMIVTSLVLSGLLLIQRQLEDPFDRNGMDDLKLDEFRF